VPGIPIAQNHTGESSADAPKVISVDVETHVKPSFDQGQSVIYVHDLTAAS
jgi:hypothetical protein